MTPPAAPVRLLARTGYRTRSEHGEAPTRIGWGLRVCRLERVNLVGLRALRTLHHVELHALVLVQAAEALRLDSREVHEDVGAAVILRDEAEALVGVEPLDRALCHLLSPSQRAILDPRVRVGGGPSSTGSTIP